AISQVFVAEGEGIGPGRLHLDPLDVAGPAMLVGQLHVIGAGCNVLELKSLVRIDRTVLVVLALVGTPIGRARRCQIELGDGDGGQVPKPSLVCCIGASAGDNQESGEKKLALHRTTTPQGSWPTGTDLITFSASTSMIEISLELPFAVTRYLPSGVKSI